MMCRMSEQTNEKCAIWNMRLWPICNTFGMGRHEKVQGPVSERGWLSEFDSTSKCLQSRQIASSKLS